MRNQSLVTLAERYAAFITQLEWVDLSAEVRRMALDLLRDWLANAAAGLGSPASRALASLGEDHDGARHAMVVGSLTPADPLWAALINGCAAHSLEFDDSFRAGLYHPGAPTISAAFSAACRAGASGHELLTSLVAGYEVSMRLACAVNPAHYRIWHTTGTVGVFGAAAAASRALGLDSRKTASALGLAGTQAAGLWEILPEAPQAKGLHPARAAHAGLLAALLSQRGIEGPATIFEGPRGFFAATVPAPVNPDECVAGLGEEWRILETTLKAYPVCGHAMTPIEAALKLHRSFAAAEVEEIEEIEEIEVRAHPVSVRVAGQPLPADEFQARFSIPYCVAVALSRGRLGMEELSYRVRESRDVRDLLGKIRLVPDDGLSGVPGRRPARVSLRRRGGLVVSELAEVRKGDPELPLTDDEKKGKFLELAAQAWGRETAKEVWEATGRLPECESVRSWTQELRTLGPKTIKAH